MMSIFFDAAHRTPSGVQPGQLQTLERWFWATSFNGWFAGANTTELRQAGDAMRTLASGDESSNPEFENFFFNRPIRAFPETFDRRSARVRASLLVQILTGHPRDPRTGDTFDGSAVFADAATRDLPYFFPNQRRPRVLKPS